MTYRQRSAPRSPTSFARPAVSCWARTSPAPAACSRRTRASQSAFPVASSTHRSARTRSSAWHPAWRSRAAAGRRDHVQRLPADRGRRDRRGAARVPLHVRRSVLVARDDPLDGRRRRALRYAALGDRRVLVHGAAGAQSGRRRDARGPYGVLRAAIQTRDPVLVIEHKGLFMRKGEVGSSPGRPRDRGDRQGIGRARGRRT